MDYLVLLVLQQGLFGIQIITQSTLRFCACGFGSAEEILCAVILFEKYCN